MRRLLLASTAVLMTGCAAVPAPLVSLTDGGELIETERAPEFSVIEVRKSPPGSVPSSMFTLRGACAVARARGEKFFDSSPVPGATRAYRITFPRAPSPESLTGRTKSVFSLSDCALLGF
jgi:hypothetical protein